jgi:hypothetical protein
LHLGFQPELPFAGQQDGMTSNDVTTWCAMSKMPLRTYVRSALSLSVILLLLLLLLLGSLGCS